MAHDQNYVIGRGRLFLDRFPDADTYVGPGERYLGNTPSLSMSSAITNLDHFSSESGMKVKDLSVSLQHDLTGTFTTDNIDQKTVALWFSGVDTAVVQVASDGNRFAESFTVQPGLFYQIGATAARPSGLSNLQTVFAAAGATVATATGELTFSGNGTIGDTIVINGVTITLVAVPTTDYQAVADTSPAGTAEGVRAKINARSDVFGVTATRTTGVLTLTANAPGTAGNAITTTEVGTDTAFAAATLSGGVGTPLVAGTDWAINAVTGRFNILAGGLVTATSNVRVSYGTLAATAVVMITGGTAAYGSLRFVADNAEGHNTDYFWPYVKLTPSGDFALKGDEFQTITMGFEVLKLHDRERVYARRR